MKKILKLTMILVLIFGMLMLTGCDKKDKEGENKNSAATARQSKYKWPDLTDYDIPDFKVGLIDKYIDTSYEGENQLNYEMVLSGVKKADIEKYLDELSEDWENIDGAESYSRIKKVRDEKYSIVFIMNKDKTVTVKISSI